MGRRRTYDEGDCFTLPAHLALSCESEPGRWVCCMKLSTSSTTLHPDAMAERLFTLSFLFLDVTAAHTSTYIRPFMCCVQNTPFRPPSHKGTLEHAFVPA